MTYINPTKIDADNRLLWRQNPRRIEAEAIRDSVLFVSGKLNLKRGGPGFEDFRYQDAYAPIYTYVTADEPALWRRSIYRYIVRTTPDRFLTTLDCPDPANFTPKRLTTTTPLQSLALYNNDFMLRQARYFAERLEKEAGKTRQRSGRTRLLALAFGRLPPASRKNSYCDGLCESAWTVCLMPFSVQFQRVCLCRLSSTPHPAYAPCWRYASLAFLCTEARGAEDAVQADLLVVGGTESGCAAAVQAARMGVERIVLVNDIEWLGGQFSAEGLGSDRRKPGSRLRRLGSHSPLGYLSRRDRCN